MTTTNPYFGLPLSVTPYTPFNGKTCYAVDGPKAHILVTQDKTVWTIWHSDSTRTLSRHLSLEQAISRASQIAAPATVEPL